MPIIYKKVIAVLNVKQSANNLSPLFLKDEKTTLPKEKPRDKITVKLQISFVVSLSKIIFTVSMWDYISKIIVIVLNVTIIIIVDDPKININ